MKNAKNQAKMTPEQYQGFLLKMQFDAIRLLRKSLPKEVTFLSPIMTKEGLVVEYKVAGKTTRLTYPDQPTSADLDRIKTIILEDCHELSRG